MFLNPDQIQELEGLIKVNHLSFVAENVGVDILSKDDLNLLKKSGFEVIPEKLTTLDYAFRFGIISTSLREAELQKWTFRDLKKFIRSGQFIPLTKYEKVVLESIKTQSFKDIKGLGNRIDADIKTFLIDVDKNKRIKYENLIREEAIKIVEKRGTVNDLVRKLAEKTQDWNRDFGRIADFIMHTAFDEGRATILREQYGDSALVYKDVYEGACPECTKLYLTNGIGSEPIKYKLIDLISNGNNIGRKTKEWLPVIGPTHPWCFPEQTEVLTNKGWQYFENLKEDELFLSVNLITQNAEWVKSIKYIKEKYKGDLINFKSNTFYLTTTPNHHHPIKRKIRSQLNPIYELKETINLKNDYSFIRTIQNWVGEEKEFLKIGTLKFNTKLWCEFLAWFLSEGSIGLVNNKYFQISITQSKNEQKRKEIFNCAKLLFKEKVWEGKENIIISFENLEIIKYFKQFGLSTEKFIPEEIKNLSKQYLEIFLKTYLKGDGTIHKGVKNPNWLNHNPKDQETFNTSSKKMSDDLGEIILKLGFLPSYQIINNIGKISYDKKGRKYITKHLIYQINKNIRIFANLKSLKKEIIKYDGYIYDVELEKYNTLFIKQNGKITLSGNCRCTLRHIPEEHIWNPELGGYKEPVGFKGKVKRKMKIRVQIGDEEKFI
jgi:hypothetical protein